MSKRTPPYVEYGFRRIAHGHSRIFYGFEPEPERKEAWRRFHTKPSLLRFLRGRYGSERAEALIKEAMPWGA